jgi:rSAM/selenodomain-associated transferase 1
MRAALAVIAKSPVPGRVKTRLCPPCTPQQAAALAEAALRDTLAAMRRTPAARRAVVLDGTPGAWLPPDFEVLAQRGGGLDERLAHAFADLDGPALILGMDTPQVTPRLLARALAALAETDAVLGPALDGGYWAIGLRRPDPAAFLGVPMSARDTCAHQRERLAALGLRVTELEPLRDVDEIADVHAVARLARPGAFAAAAERLAA